MNKIFEFIETSNSADRISRIMRGAKNRVSSNVSLLNLYFRETGFFANILRI